MGWVAIEMDPVDLSLAWNASDSVGWNGNCSTVAMD